MKKLIAFSFIGLLSCSCIFADVFAKALVLKTGGSEIRKNVKIEDAVLKIISGSHKNEIVGTKNYLWDEENYNTELKPGGVVVVRITETDSGGIDGVFVKGYVRDKFLFLIILIFFAVLLLVCGKKGLMAAASILINIFLLVKVLIPLVKSGYPPFFVCVCVALLGSAVTLFLVLGSGKNFFAALGGIAAGILFAGAATLVFLKLSNVSGIFIEGSRMLVTASRTFGGWNISDFKGLVAGGTIIASLGAVIDVVVDIVAGMASVAAAKPEIGMRELYNSGLEIGRDVLGGMLGSLLFVFVGSSLVMIVVYTILHIPFLRVINWEFFDVVVVQALVSSMSFIVSVPASVFFASAVYKHE